MKKVAIVGLGNMGESIVRALLNAGMDKAEILSFELKAARAQAMAQSYAIEAAQDPRDLAARCRYVILAVKPQDAKAAISALAPSINESNIVISIMAGVTASTISTLLERPAKVVRVMPNICIAIGEGALGIAPNHLLSKDELEAVGNLLRPLGRVVEVSEEQMDAVTALAGSGPAFVLSFLEALTDGGVKMGLARDKAYSLALQTMKGTVAMLDKERLHPALMKEAITSPGGTTIAGLVILDEKGFKGNVVRALEAAQNRARELSK
jgi:pyrroline-5-carboxylate reductase